MQVKIKNIQLSQVYELLHKLPLKGKESRHRTKFIKLIQEQFKKVTEDENELLKEHCHLDEEGNPKKTEDGKRWDVKDIDAFVNDRNELYNEEFVIAGDDKQTTLEVVKAILENLDIELKGDEADIYEELCEQFGIE